MPSELGKKIRNARTELGIGVRELGRIIDVSPSMIVRLEQDDRPPSMSEEKLTAVAEALELEPDEVVVLAGKIPEDVKPETAYEVALYRKVKQLSPEAREKLLRQRDDEEGEG